jgi:glycosyltransferase involved in cell wall biosynthesis
LGQRMHLNAVERLEGGRRISGLSRADAPLVTIITVVFRAEQDLARILESVFKLDTRDFELIVIDGDSGDATVKLLHQWDDKIEYWLSEPDKGIYDAMNKGQDYARGHFLYHLNAGDRLLQIPREELELAQRDGIDIAAFRVSVDGNREFRPAGGLMLKLKNTLHHQGTFYRRESFLKYNLKYKVIADFDVNQRLALRGARIRCFDKIVAWHESGGAGDSMANYREHASILRANHGWFWMTLSIALSEWKGIKARRTTALKQWLQKGRA